MPSTTTPTMERPLSAEPPAGKSSKRKGTRSVSTLTPSQLARKRANDREAQRAIRARTKEHIERLEQELEQLRSHQNRDRTVQDLLRRNKALEDELNRLRESMGMSLTSSPYSAPAAYDEQQAVNSSGSGTIPSPRMSPLAASAEYNPLPDYGQHYVPMSGGSNVDSWAANVPSHINSNVSSPSSSADDYVSGYIPTSVPTTMMPTSNSLESLDNFRMNNMQMQGVPPTVYMQQQQQQQQQAQQHQHQQQQGSPQGEWQVYNMYYNSQMPKGGEACLSR